jgi:hypothetical protein
VDAWPVVVWAVVVVVLVALIVLRARATLRAVGIEAGASPDRRPVSAVAANVGIG